MHFKNNNKWSNYFTSNPTYTILLIFWVPCVGLSSFFVLCPMLLVSLDCPFLIAVSVFYNVYSLYIFHYINCGNTNSKFGRGRASHVLILQTLCDCSKPWPWFSSAYIAVCSNILLLEGVVSVFSANVNNISVILLKLLKTRR